MADLIQRSWAGGTLSPELWGRADLERYGQSAKTLRNFVVGRHGSLANRAGFQFAALAKHADRYARVRRFVFSSDQAYMITFGHQHLRLFQNGAPVVVTSVAAWDDGTTYAEGDIVAHSGVTYRAVAASTNQEPPNATFWYPLTADTFEMPTPYEEDTLEDLRFTQSADTLIIVHPEHPPRRLVRSGHTTWILSELPFQPSLLRPLDLAATAGPSGSIVHRYQVTAVSRINDEESFPALDDGTAANRVITAISAANPTVITTASAHGLLNGEEVVLGGMTDIPELGAGRLFRVTDVTSDTFKIRDVITGDLVDGTGFSYTSGGSVFRTSIRLTAGAATAASPHTITWLEQGDARYYWVYRATNGVFALIGRADGPSFEDVGTLGDSTQTPPIPRSQFALPGQYPSIVSFIQQRLGLGGPDDDPERVLLSRTGQYANFSVSTPLRDDDAISFIPASGEVNRPVALLEIGKPVLLTTGGEWTMEGDTDGVLRPTAINLRQHTHIGAAQVPPAVVGDTAIFVQNRRNRIYDLRYAVETEGYRGNDLTVYAPHLFDDVTVIALAYQRIPHSVVWALRSDGVLLGLTYVREQEVWAWHVHDTPHGFIESIDVIPEGTEDRLYAVVRRTNSGGTYRSVERLATRRVTDIAIDAIFLDSCLTYDGRNTDTGHTLTLTSAGGWTSDDDLTLTSSEADYFDAGEIDNAYHLTIGGVTLRCRVTTFTSGTVVTVRAHQDVPAAFQGVATAIWARAVDEFAGLDHLEGHTVGVLADGNVEDQQTVASGAIALQQPYAVVHVGLPIIADMEPLDVEVVRDETIKARRKMVRTLFLEVKDSRGIYAGPDADHLRSYPQMPGSGFGSAVPLQNGVVEIALAAEWRTHGRILIRQQDPLPLEILGMIRTVEVGG